MNLHHDLKSFSTAIQASSDKLNIPPVFIEKDYWITLVLKRLAESAYHDSVVFKGGTTLAKGFRLIDRFSEDIDIAVIDVQDKSGNQVKNLIRDVEKEISIDLTEIDHSLITSKGSRFRKSVFTYPKIVEERFYPGISGYLIIEINSFANPFPFERKSIDCLIRSALERNNQSELIVKYDLFPFTINVLDQCQTLLEKLASLFRSSFEIDPATGIAGKIRHFYDLYFMFTNEEGKAFLDSKDFAVKFNEVWSHDQVTFEVPEGWQGKSAYESPLYLQWPEIWNNVKGVYTRELSALSFSEIPDEKIIAATIIYIFQQLSANNK